MAEAVGDRFKSCLQPETFHVGINFLSSSLQLSFLPVKIPQDLTIINDKKPSKEQCTMFTDLSLQVALGSVPSSQTSLYRWP